MTDHWLRQTIVADQGRVSLWETLKQEASHIGTLSFTGFHERHQYITYHKVRVLLPNSAVGSMDFISYHEPRSIEDSL